MGSKNNGTNGRLKNTHFPRRERISDLKAWGDRRWRVEAKRDLTELVEDDEGIARLADVIKAILRSKK